MAKYKVKVIEMSLKNNKVAVANSIVTDEELDSSADDLIKKGFLSRLTKSDLDALKSKENTNEKIPEKSYAKMNKEELQAELSKREIVFDEKSVNADLVKLLETNDEEDKD